MIVNKPPGTPWTTLVVNLLRPFLSLHFSLLSFSMPVHMQF